MNHELIAETETALDGTTPGRWRANGSDVETGDWPIGTFDNPVDAAFIAAAPELATRLVAALREAEERRQKDDRTIGRLLDAATVYWAHLDDSEHCGNRHAFIYEDTDYFVTFSGDDPTDIVRWLAGDDQ